MASRKPETTEKTRARLASSASPPAPGDHSTATPRPRRSPRTMPVAHPALQPLPSVGRLPAASSRERWREAARIAVVMAGVLLLLGLINRTGAGSVVATSLDWGAFLVPPVLVALGLDALRRVDGGRPFLRFEEINGVLALFAGSLIAVGAPHHGGPIGNAMADELTYYFGTAGVPVACAFLIALGLVLALHLTSAHVWLALRRSTSGFLRAGGGTMRVGTRSARWAARRLPRPAPRFGGRRSVEDALIIDAEVISVADAMPVAAAPSPIVAQPPPPPRERQRGASIPAPSTAARSTAEVPATPRPEGSPGGPQWTLPPVAMLATPPPAHAPTDNTQRMRLIEDTLTAFSVRARVVGAHSGPTVTRFDVLPERGVRVSRVTALQNDLALALAARTIRIQAPVPGQSVVGIEIPNAKTSLVTLREVLESDACVQMASPLKVALGKDVSGEAIVADLARMPHLLIAGSTGSGKSVCLNSLISCLLFHNSPEQLRLLMIDPKMVELTVFNGVPHLLAPVVTDVTKVTGTLKWALKEMHRRYKLFAERGARNLARYNELQTDSTQRLPFIVIIIDELADLMMVSPEDVEDGICRLAQLARATGMHLVLATQRPSVDVITGLIKANFPARIAFAVSSQVDSRTILDQTGAEKLLGRGDMLYQPPDEGKPVRVQGTYLSDREIEELVAFWGGKPDRGIERISEEELAPAREEEPEGDDKLLNDAIRVLREYRRASVSLLQRRLSIGYTRAARLLDTLEERGIVGPSEDGRSRVVLEVSDAGDVADAPLAADGVEDESPPL